MKQLDELKGLGPKGLRLLNQLGIHTINDLIGYYPFRYDILKRSDINVAMKDDKVIVDGVIESVPRVFHINRKMDKMDFKMNVQNHLLNITIFNRGFLKSQLSVGKEVTIIGKYDPLHNHIVASELRLGRLEHETIEPVYHTIYGISSKQLSHYIAAALKNQFEIEDYVLPVYQEKYYFPSKTQSIQIVHQPTNEEVLKKAEERIKYEELFLFMLKMNYLKNNKQNKIGLKRDVDYQKIQEFMDTLPYSLTEDQEKSVKAIYQDLMSPTRMNRLLQGDVGSGKTVVALIASYINYLSGYQSALMAPTEILAEQHYQNAISLCKDTGMRIGLLTGKMKAKEKKEVYRALKEGNIDFIIGTHALFTDTVEYANLGFVITDEQHRFGVNQRSSLKNKGITPDILYMSATPIPRTYALTLYGDMDISSIKTVPRGRKPVITTIASNREMKQVLGSMYEQIKQGHQIYVIAPLIEESDKSDFENINELSNKMNRAFGKVCQIGTLHGKMKPAEKEKVMNQFANNELQILISTTVVEVGVDVPNATMMVIFDSYRFGLSALHQLRGRVGRSELQSYCILMSERETERLQILTQTNDGFKVSEEDFLLRGSGDLFGAKQSGDMVFQMANLKNDFPILLNAKQDSEEFLNAFDGTCLLYPYPSPRYKRQYRMPSAG